jgi:hypothetical protein
MGVDCNEVTSLARRHMTMLYDRWFIVGAKCMELSPGSYGNLHMTRTSVSTVCAHNRLAPGRSI